MGLKISGSDYTSATTAATPVTSNTTQTATQTATQAATQAVTQAVNVQNVSTNESTADTEGFLTEQQMNKIKSTVSNINKISDSAMLQYGFHDATNRVVIKVVDKTTKKVIKEYPSEELLDMVAKVMEQAGLLVDEKR